MFIKDEIIFIDLEDIDQKNHFFCNICSYPFITKNDFDNKRKYNCCNECYLHFIEGRKSMWEEGWRPDKSHINEYLKIRKSLKEKIINITGD